MRATRVGVEANAAFTLSGFDNQERNLTFVKTAFQVFYEASFLSTLQTKYRVSLVTRNYFFISFLSVPDCQTCMCKCGINYGIVISRY